MGDDTERRRRRRTATRLRPAKILDRDNRFIGDCAIVDRSADGVRVRLFTPLALPDDLLIFDEGERLLHPARPIWSAALFAGFGFVRAPERLGTREADAIAGRYYAVAR